MPPKSAVISSKYRKEIEEFILEGQSARFISSWLKEQEPPESISHTAINNYKKGSFNVHAEAAQQYVEKKSKERKDEGIAKVVSDLEFCDDIIQLANKVDLKVDNENKITALDIKKLGLQAIKTKQEVFKQGSEDEKEFRIIIEAVDSDENNQMETQQKTSE
jgi:predicted transcriptional regulator